MYKVSIEQFYKNLEDLKKAKQILDKIYDIDSEEIFDLSSNLYSDLAITIMNTMGITRPQDQDVFFEMLYSNEIIFSVKLQEDEIEEYQVQETFMTIPYDKFYEFIIENKSDFLEGHNV